MCANWGFVWIGYRNVHTFIPQICHCGIKQEKFKAKLSETVLFLETFNFFNIFLIRLKS